ncbi:nucleotidyltransferase family protein [Metallosphaera tengchongensis]|uniref:Nucleotidyltransferase family protein n=1 Tax=Metallosphaera tengchongensis TaxID=1532350 RepID=A0A6N0NZ49_9CREN|nr:nucleotidyltransferase family protein [Metallosphaera tengchongensis]QKR01103.1 nucleotidyltransferase family protein [Metallosphaera tengchongensis]
MTSIGAVILAGGDSTRFGKNKLLVKLKGVPILLRVISAIPQPRIIVAGKYAVDIIAQFPDEIVIYNPNWTLGMSTSLKLGLRYFQDKDGVLVALGDMPLLTREIVEKIVSSYTNNCVAVVPTYKGKWGNPVILSRALFSEVEKLQGDVGAKNILRRKMENICFVETGEEVLIDVDTEADLVEVSRRLP